MAKYIMGHFAGFFEGAETFLTPKLSRAGHKITNAPLILKIRDIIFLFLGKVHNGPFLGLFRGGLDFFDP